MSDSPSSPPIDPRILLRIITVLAERNTRLEAEVATYRRMVFGARSERSAVILPDQGQLDLGDASSVQSGANDNTGMAQDAPGQPDGDGSRRSARRNVGVLISMLN